MQADAVDENLETVNVLYAGVPLAGMRSSLAHILPRAGVPLAELVRCGPFDITWSEAGRSRSLRVLQDYRGPYYIPRLSAVAAEYARRAHIEDAYTVTLQFLCDVAAFMRIVDGIVLVIDSQRERLAADAERVEMLVRDLEDAGRDPHVVPLVFQLNKRDLPNAERMELLQDALQWPGPTAYVESVAKRGLGASEALETLLRLCPDDPVKPMA